jgi:AsmA protein
MASPLLRVVATGNADLVEKTLDMRVKPKVVGTLKGQQDTKERRGLMVPVLVTGTFSSPRFAPDLKGILETEIGEKLKTPEGIMDILEGGDTSKEGTSVTDREKVKEALEGLLGK